MATSKLLFEEPQNEVLKKDLLSQIAEDTVKSFVESKKDKNGKVIYDKKGNPILKNDVPSPSQIRKFYNDVLSLKNRLEIAKGEKKEERFKQLLPYIKMLKAKVAYAKTRNNVNSQFKEFIDDYVNSIRDIDDFYAFCDFFEAIVAYSSFHLKSN